LACTCQISHSDTPAPLALHTQRCLLLALQEGTSDVTPPCGLHRGGGCL